MTRAAKQQPTAPPLRILLVDDNLDDLALTRKAFLAVAPRARLTEISDSREVVPYLRGEGRHADRVRPHIILMDLNMPKVSGHEALAAIKDDPKLATIPVIILSANESGGEVLRSYQLHANSHVSKPPDFQQLKALAASIHHYWADTEGLPMRELKQGE